MLNIITVKHKTELSLVVYLSHLCICLQVSQHIGRKKQILFQHNKLIRESGIPNFGGLRNPVHTQLNVKAWRFHLRDYWDQQLVDLIEYGFPLDFDRDCQ